MPRKGSRPIRSEVEKVSKNDALWAIVGWMGSYEGHHGTLEDLTNEGLDDAALLEEDFPAEIVAGYRLARSTAEKHDNALLRERARGR